MCIVPRNRAAQRQQILQISQINRNPLYSNDYRINANSRHLNQAQVHRHVIQAQCPSHRAANLAQAVQHLRAKQISGKYLYIFICFLVINCKLLKAKNWRTEKNL